MADGLGLSPAEVNYQLSHLQETKGPAIRAGVAVLSVLATIAVFLRFLVRWRTKAGCRADDYTVFAACLFCWFSFISFIYQVRNGYGRHILATTPKEVKPAIKAFFFNEFNFILSVTLTQISLLLLYRRVFNIHRLWFRNTLYVLGVFTATINLGIFIIVLVNCRPLSKIWDQSVKGRCFSARPFYSGHTVLTLVLDMCIVAAPLPLIWGLQASLRTKVAVCGIFLLGGFVCIINVIRLTYIIKVPRGDVSWTDVSAGVWSHAEICLGIVSVCLPCYRPLFRDLKAIFSSDKSKTTSSTLPPGSPHQIPLGDPLGGTAKTTLGSNIELVSTEVWSAPSLPDQSLKVQLDTHPAGRPEQDAVQLGGWPEEDGVIRNPGVVGAGVR